MKIFQLSLILLSLFSSGCINNADNKINNTQKVDRKKLTQALISYKSGKKVYGENCVPCHGWPTSQIDGPSLFDNLFDRLPQPSREYFVRFVKNSKYLKSSGDMYIKKLESEYQVNLDHFYDEKLTDQEIRNILSYIVISSASRN